jgi:hypothetical protein
MILFNVTSDMFETSASYPTQDIEFNSTPAVDLADAKTTREITGLRIKYASDRKELYKHLENGQPPNCGRCATARGTCTWRVYGSTARLLTALGTMW